MKKDIDIRCPDCGKLIARIEKNGYCKNIVLYCRSCKKELIITIKKKETQIEERSN